MDTRTRAERPDMEQPAGGHEHGWQVESTHVTSSGLVVYVRCGDCGTRRLDLQEEQQAVPAALSREVPAPDTRGATQRGASGGPSRVVRAWPATSR